MHQLVNLAQGVTREVALAALFVFQLAAALSVPSVLLRRRGSPTSALVWLLVLFALPVVGTLAWWVIGRSRIERRLRAHFGNKRLVIERIGAPKSMRGTVFESLLPGRARGENAFSTSGNAAKLLTDGHDAFRAIESDLRAAEKCVHMLFYIFKYDSTGHRICSVLEDCARRGVVVRLLLDGFGSRETIRRIKKRLASSGVLVGIFFPARFWPLTPRLNFVNHRKIITIDDRIAYTGGMNIGEEYEASWRDLMVRVEGPAVEGLNHIFLEDWFFATQSALPDPPGISALTTLNACDVGIVSSGPDTEDWIHDAYFLAITQAKERLYLTTPYFIPTPAILAALRTASGRGVDVRLVMPSLSDVRLVMWASRSFYRPLVQAGVRIFEYSEKMLHAKALIMDDGVCAIGTANLDNRSFRLNFEVTCFLSSSAITQSLAHWVEDLIDHSEEITAELLDKKSTRRKLIESAAHLLSPLL